MTRRPPSSTLFPSATLFRSQHMVQHKPQPDADRSDEDDKARPSVDVSVVAIGPRIRNRVGGTDTVTAPVPPTRFRIRGPMATRSEEHTSELQSRSDLVCRLL